MGRIAKVNAVVATASAGPITCLGAGSLDSMSRGMAHGSARVWRAPCIADLCQDGEFGFLPVQP